MLRSSAEPTDFVHEIDHLMWWNMDEFMNGLARIAEGETNRKVINEDLRVWWKQLLDVVKRFPKDAMPLDV